MPIRPFRSLLPRASWRPAERWVRAALPGRLARWLFDPGSLTRLLRSECRARGRAFDVCVLREGRFKVLPDEARALGLGRVAYAWVREVHLRADGEPWVFARTVIPLATLRGPLRVLAGLGTRSLGEVLFADHRVKRGGFTVARIDVRQPLHRRVLGLARGEPLWARRSRFSLDGTHALLVCEIFLPAHPATAESAVKGR